MPCSPFLGQTVCFFAAASPLTAADWPQFLGPNRDGVARESPPLITEVPGDGIPLVWNRAIGEGFAGPVVAGDHCLIFHRRDDEAVVEALARATGETIWTASYPTSYRDRFGFDEGPRSCPTVEGERVFTYGAEGVLQCLDLKTGRRLWNVDLAADHGSPQGFFGRACAPLIAEHLVLVASGSADPQGPCVHAFEADTGKLVWSAGNGEAGYASPLLAKSGPDPLALFFTREGLLALNAKTGFLVYQEPFRAVDHASVNAASPVLVDDGRVWLSSCYEAGAALWSFGPTAASWRSLWKLGDRLDCHYATPVPSGDHLFGFHGRQESGQDLRCIAWADGKILWKSERIPAGSLILADATLLILTERGELLAAPADPARYELRWRAQLTGADTRAAPAFSDGFFFARDRRQLVCADLRAKGPGKSK
ncbi:MAG TPA: PQQ-binding-like beta-propeller repeat protein [Verrucomicrobiales bacterium]|nr:PQQ-binding-like beta-propeller repeat protein [Verrucomicrobiales bacterium]